jgi:hypothetical protein
MLQKVKLSISAFSSTFQRPDPREMGVSDRSCLHKVEQLPRWGILIRTQLKLNVQFE